MVVSTAFIIPEVRAGYGQHLAHLSKTQITEALKWYWFVTMLFILNVAASKISICLFLLRVLGHSQLRLRRTFLLALIRLLTVTAIFSVAYTLGQCHPVKKLWNPMEPGHCLDAKIFVDIGYTNGGKLPRSIAPKRES